MSAGVESDVGGEGSGTISVIVPCRDEAGHIEAFLDGVRAQRPPAGMSIEVVVADGMSADGTRDALDHRALGDPALRVVDNPAGFVASGLNRAIAAARGDVLVRMDVHTRYAEDYVRECVAALEATGADVVGGPWRAAGHDAATWAIAAAFQSPFGMGGGRAHRADHEGPVDTVYLGCWRRETLERHGGFDEAIIRSQDAELNWRIRRAGGVVWQTPRIRSWYLPRRSFRDLFRQFAQYGYWKMRLIRKHRSAASLRHFAPAGLLLGTVVAAALVPWTGAVGIAAVAASYLAANAVASITAARAAGSLRLAPRVAVAFAVFHLAYGYGSLRGLLDGPAGGPGEPTSAAWTQPSGTAAPERAPVSDTEGASP